MIGKDGARPEPESPGTEILGAPVAVKREHQVCLALMSQFKHVLPEQISGEMPGSTLDFVANCIYKYVRSENHG